MWEIFTFGGGDFLRLVLNGLASIFGEDNYNTAMVIAAILGLLSVMVMSAFRKGELNVQWLIAVIMIYQIALVPKKDIAIVDMVVPVNNAVVANVPMGIAFSASLFSRFSNWATGAMETVFALPNDMRVRGNGLLFANTLVEESTRFEITEPLLSQNFSQFWKDCVFYDIALSLYTWDDLVKTTNLIGFLSDNTSTVRRFTYIDGDGIRSIIECREGLVGNLIPDYNAEIENATNIHGVRLVPHEVDNDAAVARFAASIPVAYQFISGLALNNAEIIGQNALANSLKRGLINFASEADAAAATQDFVLARAEGERRTTFLTMGLLAKKMLPILQHIFEAFIYAIFPFIMLIAMTPLVGKVMLGYLKALFWINLWPPLYAILHFAITYHSAGAARSALIQDGDGFAPGLSVMTNTGLGNVLEDYAAIAGYLTASIPMISWMMVSMSGAMMAGLAGRLIQGYERPVSGSADDANAGNVGVGNIRYMNTSAFQENTSPNIDAGMINERLGSGSEMMTTPAARYLQQNMSSGPTSISTSNGMVASSQQQLDSAVQQMNSESAQLSQSSMSALKDSFQLANRASSSQTNSNGMSSSERNMSSIAQQELNSAMNNWSRSEGVELSDSLQASIRGAVEGGLKLPIFGGASMGVEAQGATGELEKANYGMAQDFMKSAQFTHAVTNIAEASRHSAISNGVSVDDSTLKSLNASMQALESAKYEYSSSVSEVESSKQSLQRAEQMASMFSTQEYDEVKNFAIRSGMSISEFDNLVIRSNEGGLSGREAREQLMTLFFSQNSGAHFDDLSLNNSSSLKGEFNQFKDQIESANANNVETVNIKSSPLNQKINAVNDSEKLSKTFDDLDSIRTENSVVNSIDVASKKIKSEGEEVVREVDSMRVLSDGVPGSAGIVGDQWREQQVEKLKEKLFSNSEKEAVD